MADDEDDVDIDAVIEFENGVMEESDSGSYIIENFKICHVSTDHSLEYSSNVYTVLRFHQTPEDMKTGCNL